MLIHTKPTNDCIPGFWDIPNKLDLFAGSEIRSQYLGLSAMTFWNMLSEDSCDSLIALFESSGISAPVSVNGLGYENLGVGSVRTTGWSEYIADQLSNIIVPELDVMQCDEFTATDWWQGEKHTTWKPVAISPMLRYMRYGKDSEHYAHYDAGYIYNERYRTLKSMVIYLTTNAVGATRFIKDNQNNIPIWDRNHSDWNRRVEPNEIITGSYPVKGKILLFNHRECHDVQQYDGAEATGRIIIRGDVIYERI